MSESTTRLITYRDLIDHCQDYLGSNVTNDASRDCRRAIQEGYRSFAAMFNWQYYYTRGRLVTNASYTTGTIEYDHTGGANERQVTLTGGTFPSWAYLGTIIIDSISYEIASLVNSTVLTLSVNSNPGEDIAAGETYTLYRDTYPLPTDFQAADDFQLADNTGLLTYVHPAHWLTSLQGNPGPGTPSMYTFRSDPNYYGTMAISLSPPPDTVENLDYIYKRRPRPMLVVEHNAGTASVAFASATVTGVGTDWRDNHIGAVIRFSEDTGKLPTGITGNNPFEIQRVIIACASTTSITLDRVVPQAFTNAKYTISDPVDIEDGAMLTGLFREIEKELRIARRMKTTQQEEMRYKEAIIQAREADSRHFGTRHAVILGRRMSDHPRGADIV